MLRIGLTGGIGSGKSTIAKLFADLDIPIIDADKIAYDLLTPNTTAYKKVVAHFGNKIVSNKNIDRNKLRELVFSNKKERVWLENLLHPLVKKKMETCVTQLNKAQTKSPYCIMVIPLLFETRFPPKVDRILAIDCNKKIRIKRIRKRNNYSTKQIQEIMSSQITRNKLLKLANDIICNKEGLVKLKKIVEKLHYYYSSIINK